MRRQHYYQHFFQRTSQRWAVMVGGFYDGKGSSTDSLSENWTMWGHGGGQASGLGTFCTIIMRPSPQEIILATWRHTDREKGTFDLNNFGRQAGNILGVANVSV